MLRGCQAGLDSGRGCYSSNTPSGYFQYESNIGPPYKKFLTKKINLTIEIYKNFDFHVTEVNPLDGGIFEKS